ncbi:coenzyme F420-reducing hydrogenase beta subunit/polysaccharide pyruvyl transferase WcaK-like protein [Rhodovulum iodosum]|uniref:Coenzyme F420-reducing hydrogenase beta subunit/polysaccharide pyruvyl transferase WcaK-like protein n=1 Tax=Rhodovulum iodosum TaxID=68291 RepID=A0ABV3XSP4_9RHOB|nr:Coenzyme F420 hydrogenase/dehydrogenase, beta subunit C-terminal domain [Rhodovulum robiginosum]RSK30671.1 hypothetical protein EJA01_18080 [Rhodovulum robiginosum]
MDKKWSNADANRFLGTVSGCFLTCSKDADVRAGAASGGTTSQILIELLSKGFIDGALVWKLGTRDGRPCAEPIMATTAEQVLSARTSTYVATYFARDAMPVIQAFDGRIAVVALPCDATYLRRRMERSPELEQQVVGILALFCGHNSLPDLTEIVCARHGVDWADLEGFTYRTGSWRGNLTMTPKGDAPIVTSTRQFTHFQNLHYFSEKKCLACFDHFGFDADLSLGDSWTLSEMNRDIKPTVCVSRTAAGDRMLELARAALDVQEIAPEHVLSGNSRGLLYHYNVSARSRAAGGMGHTINDRLHLPTSFLDRIIARMGVGNALWSWRDADARRKLERRPFWAVKAQIYAFKALQELNSYAWRRYPDNRQISLIGATLTGNQGAAAMLETSIGEISKRFPEARFVVHSYFPDADRAACTASHVRIVDARPKALVLSALPAMIDGVIRHVGLRVPNVLLTDSLREIRNSSVLVDISGISLADGREKFLPFNLLCTWPAVLTGTPVVKLSQAMGPAKRPLTRLFARFLLNRMQMNFARGETTMDLIAPLVAEEKRAIAADIAFLYASEYALVPQWSDKLDELASTISRKHGTTIAISVSTVVARLVKGTGQDYVDLVSRTIERLLENGHEVVVFPNACREGTDSTHNNDIPLIHALAERLGDRDGLYLVDHAINTVAIRKLLSACDCLITSRFHAMVAGLSLAVPTLVLGWSHKYQEVMKMFGTEGRFLAAGEMTEAAIAAAVEELLSGKDAIRQELAQHGDEVRALAAVQFEWLDAFLQPEAETSGTDG